MQYLLTGVLIRTCTLNTGPVHLLAYHVLLLDHQHVKERVKMGQVTTDVPNLVHTQPAANCIDLKSELAQVILITVSLLSN